MKRLEHAEPPECLSRYKAGRDNWESLSLDDTDIVRQRLYTVQGGVCAYCEVELKTHTSVHCHIEHFAPRSGFAQHTYTWANLLLSCNHTERCGHHKGRRWSNKLVNPALDEPADCIDFLDTGLVRPHGAEGSETHERGRVTIDVLNLDLGPLRRARAGALKSYLSARDEIPEQLMSLDDLDLIREWLESELSHLHEVQFAAPVRSFLCNMLRKLPLTPAS